MDQSLSEKIMFSTTRKPLTQVIHVWGLYLAVRILAGILVWSVVYTRYLSFPEILMQWDSEWYYYISVSGYDNVPPYLHDRYYNFTAFTSYAFFPGFPVVFRFFCSIVPLPAEQAAILCNGIFAGIAATAIYYLTIMCCQKTGFNQKKQRMSGYCAVIVFSALPMSIVYSLIYSEALYIACALWALVSLCNHKYITAGVFTALAGCTRASAFSLLLVVIVTGMGVVCTRSQPTQMRWHAFVGVLLAPLGWLGYLGWVALRKHELTAWFTIEKTGWGTHFDLGENTLTFFKYILLNYVYRPFDPKPYAYATIFTAVTIALYLLLLLMFGKFHIPWPITVYTVLSCASVVLSGDMIYSRPRLLLVACPVIIPVVMWVVSRSERAYQALSSRSLLLEVASQWRYLLIIIGVIGGLWSSTYMLTIFPHAF